MNYAQWINAELKTATEQYERAAAEFNNAGFDLTIRDPSDRRNYWSGYADALTNALNELAGPGDTN